MKILWVEDSADLLEISAIKRYFSSFLNEQDRQRLESFNDVHFFKLKKCLESELSNPIYIRSDLVSAFQVIFEQKTDFDLIVLDVKFPPGNNLELLEKIKKDVFMRYEDIEKDKIILKDFYNFINTIFTEDTHGIIMFDLIYNRLKESKSDNEIKQMICFFSGNDEDCVKFETRLQKLKKNKYNGVRESMKIGKGLFFKKSSDASFIEFVNAKATKFSIVLSSFFNSGILHSLTHGKLKSETDFDKIKKMSFYSFLSSTSQKLFRDYFDEKIENDDFKDKFRLESILELELFQDLSDGEYDTLKAAFNNKYAETEDFKNIFNMIISNIVRHSHQQFTGNMFNYCLNDKSESVSFIFSYSDNGFDFDRFQNGKTFKHFKELIKYGSIKISNNRKTLDICSEKYFDNDLDKDIIRIEIEINL